ncbi:MAG: putative DNA binding domain-containing protein [Bacteroidetes bacterium]|nr:putative DNA binding domain-containing protein [Bacteroidota bacterium]
MNKIELNKLLNSETETEILEFKKAERQFDKDKLGRYFSALSNEANLHGKEGAWLLFGVANDKTIISTSISDKQLNEYKREISNHTSPTLNFIKAERISTEKGNVIMLQIPAAPKGQPVSWKGHYYGRDGESLGALNSEEYDRIRNQIISTDWSAQIIKEASINDLFLDAISKAREQFTEKNPKLIESINSWDDITFLNKAKVCINGQITNTAILLLGNPESEHYINPAVSKISWILKDRDNIEKDYAHFTCPLLLEVEGVFAKIRNLKYRYLQSGTLFPDEVDQFEPYIIREAINNCISHQDYSLGGKINVVEREDGILTFVNSGSFIPGSVEKVIEADAPETEYRNPFLANAMVNLNMIDTIGSGIRKMFVIQKNKYFPLPEYDFSNTKVQVQIIGKVLDENYAKKLALNSDLSLPDIILLDKVAKHKNLTDSEIKYLRSKKLIEGRRPNFYVSSTIAEVTGKKAVYIKQRGFKDDHYKKMILEFIEKYGKASKNDIDNLLLEILPSVLNEKKKANKVRNIIYAMSKKDITIINQGTRKNPEWIKV